MSPSTVSNQRTMKWPKRLAVIVVVVSILYCAMGCVSLATLQDHLVLYWLAALEDNVHLMIIGVLWLGLLTLTVCWLQKRLDLGWLLVAATCLAFGTVLLYLAQTPYLDTAKLNGQVYYLVDNYDWYSRWHTYSLCECGGSSITCQCQDFYTAYSPIIVTTFSLTADATANRLEVKLNNKVLYEHGASPHCYQQADLIGHCLEK